MSQGLSSPSSVQQVPGNSTTTPLANAAVYTGAWTFLGDNLTVGIHTSSDVAPTVMVVQFSEDGATVSIPRTINITVAGVTSIPLPREGQYFRIVYTNTAGVPQTAFKLAVAMYREPMTALVGERPARESLPITGTVTTVPSGTQTVAGTVEIGATSLAALELIGVKGADGSAIVSNANPVPISDAGGSITVDGVFFQATQPVSGSLGRTWDLSFSADQVDVSGSSVSVTNFPASQAVTGPLTDTQLRASVVPVSLASTTITGSVAVTGTFFQATQPVSAVDLDIRNLLFASDKVDASGSSVSVSNFPASQAVTGTVAVTQSTSPWVTSLASTTITGSVAVTGPLTNTELRASAVPVSGTFFQATQPVSAASLPLPAGAATSALQTQPGVDIGDVTVNNATGAGAVNIQDGGNSITVDGTVGVSGSVAVTGTFFQATQPVSGTVAVTQSTSPWVTSLASTTITGTVAVSGPLTDTQLRASEVSVKLASGDTYETVTITTAVSGNNIIRAPAAGKAVRLHYLQMNADGANSADVTASVRFGAAGSLRYTTSLKAGSIFARNIGAGRRYVQGAVNEVLYLNLSAAQTANSTVELEEV